MFVIIAAIGKNRELGKNNSLIWHLPADLKFFKETTLDKKIIMGKNTFDSLKKTLPRRKHIVLASEKFDCDDENVIIYTNKDKLINDYIDTDEEIFICGGASIYSLFLPFCKKMYLTHINEQENSADVYFPEYNIENYNYKVLKSDIDNNISYSIVEYIKK